MTAAVFDFATERAKRRAPAYRPLIAGRPLSWWAYQLTALAVLVVCFVTLCMWITP